MIRITAKKAGFRRAGITHSATPIVYPDDFFDGERLRALYEEPMLVVETLPDPEPKPPVKKGKSASRTGVAPENQPPGDPGPADPNTHDDPERAVTGDPGETPIDANVTPSPSGEGVGDAGAP
ncbi:MAG: hypothetical protein JNK31_04875 [Candidatus Competibacter sp.]|nr:hypothetical protein [Candidatus Competibacter sp.]